MTNRRAQAPAPEKKAYTYDEVAEITGLSRRTLYNHVQAGKLIPTYPTGEPRFSAKEVDRWIAAWPAEPPVKEKTSA